MGKFMEAWAARVGPVAAATMRRSKRYTVLACLCAGAFPVYVALGVAAGLRTAGWVGTTAGYLSWLWVVGAVAFLVLSIRGQVQARRQAADHLGLPRSSAKYVPLRAAWLFDTWIARRDAPSWPRVAPRR
jgi:hypothetical protein